MSGYQYSSLLASRTTTFIKTYQQATKQSNAYVVSLVQQIAMESRPFSLMAVDRFIRPILSTSFKHKNKFIDPLLEWLNVDDTIDSLLKSLKTDSHKTSDITTILSQIPTSDYAFLEYSVKKEKLLFIFEALSISLALGQFLRHSFFPGDPLIATTVFRQLFPEFTQEVVDMIFKYSDSLNLSGLPKSLQDVEKELSTSQYPEVSQYNKTLINTVTQLAVSGITFSQDLATAFLSDGSVGRDNATNRLITAYSVLLPPKTTRYQKFAITSRTALQNDYTDGADDESTNALSLARTRFDRTSSTSIPQSVIFGRSSYLTLPSPGQDSLNEIPQFVSISNLRDGTDIGKLRQEMDTNEMFAMESADLYEGLKMTSQTTQLPMFENLASSLPAKEEQVAGLVSCVMELHKMLRDPIWSAPVENHSFKQATPVALVGPPQSGKSSVINMLAVAQTQLGIPTQVVRINASSRTISQLLGSFGKEAQFSEEEEILQEILSHELQFVNQDGQTNLELTDPPNVNVNSHTLSSTDRWDDGIIPNLAKESSFTQMKHSHLSSSEEIFIVIDLGSPPLYQVSSTCDEASSSTRGHNGRPPIAELSANAPDPSTGWINKLGSLLRRSSRFQMHLRTDYLRGLTKHSREKRTNLEKTGVLVKNPYETEGATKNDIIELLLADYHHKMNNLSNPIKRFRKKLRGPFPTLSFFQTTKKQNVTDKQHSRFRQRNVEHTMKNLSKLNSLFTTHRKKTGNHQLRLSHQEDAIRRRFQHMTKRMQLTSDQLTVVDEVMNTLGRKGGTPRQEWTVHSDSSIMNEYNESLFRSNCLRLPNQLTIRFKPNIRILFETVSMDHIPVDFAANLSVLRIPGSLFSQPSTSLFLKEVPFFSPSASVVFEHIYTELVTNFITYNSFVTENWMKDPVLSNIYRHMINATGVLTTRLQDAGMFVRQYFNNKDDSSSDSSTTPRTARTSTASFNRMFGRNSAFFENVASTFLNNTLALYKAHMKYLLPVVLMGIFRQYQSILASTGVHRNNHTHQQVKRSSKPRAHMWKLPIDPPVVESSDSMRILLDINPNPSTLHEIRTHHHPAVQSDLAEVRRKMNNQETDRETLADYIVNLSTGVWERATLGGVEKFDRPIKQSSHTVTMTHLVPLSRTMPESSSHYNSQTSLKSPRTPRSTDKLTTRHFDSFPLGNEITFQHTHELYNQSNHPTIICMENMEPLQRLSKSLVKAPHTIPNSYEPEVTFVCPISPYLSTMTLSDIVTHIHQTIHLTSTASSDSDDRTPRDDSISSDMFARQRRSMRAKIKPINSRLTNATIVFPFFPPYSLHTLDFVHSIFSDGLVSGTASVSNVQRDGLHISFVSHVAFALWLPPRYLKMGALTSIPVRTLVPELETLDSYFFGILTELGVRRTLPGAKTRFNLPLKSRPSLMNLMTSLSVFFSPKEMETLRPALGIHPSIGPESKQIFQEDQTDEKLAVESILARIPFMTLIICRLLSATVNDLDPDSFRVKKQLLALFPEVTSFPLQGSHPMKVLQVLANAIDEDHSIIKSPSFLVVEWMRAWEETLLDRLPLIRRLTLVVILAYFGNLLLTQSSLNLDTFSEVLDFLPIPNAHMISDAFRLARTRSIIDDLGQNAYSKTKLLSILLNKATDPHPNNLNYSVMSTAATVATKIKKSNVAVLTFPHFVISTFVEQVSNSVSYPIYPLRIGRSKPQFLANIREMILAVINSPKPMIITFEVNSTLALTPVVDPVDLRRPSKDTDDGLGDLLSFTKPNMFLSTRHRVGSETRTDFDLDHPQNPVITSDSSPDVLTPLDVSTYLYILAESNVSLLYFFTNEQMHQILMDISSSGNKDALHESYLNEQFRKKHRFLFFLTHYSSMQGKTADFSITEQQLAQEQERVETGNMFLRESLASETSKTMRKQNSLDQYPGLQMFGWFLTSFEVALLETFTAAEHRNSLIASITLGKIRGIRIAESRAQTRLRSSILYSRDHYAEMVATKTVLNMLDDPKRKNVGKSLALLYAIDDDIFPPSNGLPHLHTRCPSIRDVHVLPTPPPPRLPDSVRWVSTLCLTPQRIRIGRLSSKGWGSKSKLRDVSPLSRYKTSTYQPQRRLTSQLTEPRYREHSTELFMETVNDTDSDRFEQPTPSNTIKKQFRAKTKTPNDSPPLHRLSKGRRPSVNMQRRQSIVSTSVQRTQPKKRNRINYLQQNKPSPPSSNNKTSGIFDENSNQIRNPPLPKTRSHTAETPLISHHKRIIVRPPNTQHVVESPRAVTQHSRHLILQQISSTALMAFLSCEKPKLSFISETVDTNNTSMQLLALEKSFMSFGKAANTIALNSSQKNNEDEDTLYLSCISGLYYVVRNNYQYFSHIGAHSSWMTFRMAVISPTFLAVMSHAVVDICSTRMVGLEARRRKLLAFHSTLFDILKRSLPPKDLLYHVVTHHFSAHCPTQLTDLIEKAKQTMMNLKMKRDSLNMLKQNIKRLAVRCREHYRKMDAAFTRDKSVTVEETQQRLSILKLRDLAFLKRNVNPPVSIRYLIDILFIILRKPLTPTAITYVIPSSLPLPPSQPASSLTPRTMASEIDFVEMCLTEDEKLERLTRGLPTTPKYFKSPITTASYHAEPFATPIPSPRTEKSAKVPILRCSMIQAKKLLFTSRFLDEIVSFDPHCISDEQIELIQPFIDLHIDDVPKDKPEITKLLPLFDFVDSILSHHRIRKSLIPHKQLSEAGIEAELTNSLAELSRLIADVDNERVRLLALLLQIQSIFPFRLIDRHITKPKLSPEQIKLVEKLISQTIHELEIDEHNIINCRGDSTLAGAFITFNGCVPLSEWDLVVEKWQRCLIICDIPFSGAYELRKALKQDLDANPESQEKYLSLLLNKSNNSNILQSPPPPDYRCLSISVTGNIENDEYSHSIAKDSLPSRLIPTWNVLHGPASFYDGQASGMRINMPSLFFIPLLELATAGQPVVILDSFGFGEHALLAYFRTRRHVTHVHILDTDFFSHAIDALVNGLPLIVNYISICECVAQPRLQNLIDCLDTLCLCSQTAPVRPVVLFGQEVTVNAGFRLFIIIKDETALLPSQNPCLFDTMIPSQCRMINMAAISMESCFKSCLENIAIKPVLMSDMTTRRQASYGRISLHIKTLLRAKDEMMEHHDVSSRTGIERFFHNMTRLQSIVTNCSTDLQREIDLIADRSVHSQVIDTLVSRIHSAIIALRCISNIAGMTQIERHDISSLIREPYIQYGVPTVQQIENFFYESIRRAISIFEIRKQSKISRSHVSNTFNAHLGSNQQFSENEDQLEIDFATGLIRLRIPRPLGKPVQRNYSENDKELQKISESLLRGFIFRIIAQMRSSLPKHAGSVRTQNITFPFLFIMTVQNQSKSLFDTLPVFTQKQLADSRLLHGDTAGSGNQPQILRSKSFRKENPLRYGKLQLDLSLFTAHPMNPAKQVKVTIPQALIDRWKLFMTTEKISTTPIMIRCDPLDRSSSIQNMTRGNLESEGFACLNEGLVQNKFVILQTDQPKSILPARIVPTSSIVISGVEQSTNSNVLTTAIGSSLTLLKTEFDSSLVTAVQTVISWITPDIEKRVDRDALLSVLLFGTSLIWGLLINRLKIAWHMQTTLTQSSDVISPDLEPNHALAQPHTLFSQPFFLRIVEWILNYVDFYQTKVPDFQAKINDVYIARKDMKELLATSPAREQITTFFTEGCRTLVKFFWTETDLPSQEAYSVQFLVERIFVPNILLPNHNFFSLLNTSVTQILPLVLPLPIRRCFTRKKAIAYLSALRVAPPPAMFQSTIGSVQVGLHSLAKIMLKTVEILVPTDSETVDNRTELESLHRETFHQSLTSFFSHLPPQLPISELWTARLGHSCDRANFFADLIFDEMFLFNQIIQTLISSLACFSLAYTSANPLTSLSLASSNTVVSPFTTRSRKELPSFFLAMTSIPYHVSHRFRDVVLWLKLLHKFLTGVIRPGSKHPSLFPLSLLISPSSFLVSQLIELDDSKPSTQHSPVVLSLEQTNRLSFTFVCRDPFSFTPGESFQTVENGVIGSYVIGITMNGFARDFANGRFVETQPGAIPSPTVTQFPVIRVTRHMIDRNLAADFSNSQYHRNEWAQSQVERYIDLSSISPFASPNNLISTQFFRLLSTKIRAARTHTSKDKHSPQYTPSEFISAHSDTVAPSALIPLGQDVAARKMHLVPLFSSAAKRSVLAEVNIENEDFAEWERKGCYLFLDFNPDFSHALQARILPV
ncbi:hypothetical protein BLNAU_1550 [Blattamonas nauphoetae]|uniref:AAA+ ATPase domain-containing protein n=1 Tax=Blattamonas nauphoetae TaxID=2049346 RepID=A0ABQ9YIE0_9EUKA|nr:hypothetical protein BLNAU_1550 [Blattamonas nauphoetae]